VDAEPEFPHRHALMRSAPVASSALPEKPLYVWYDIFIVNLFLRFCRK